MSEFHYQLGTHTKEQYDALDVSLRDADDPTYVARAVSQTDDILHSPTRGVFWLSEEEAAELEQNPQIAFIHKNPDNYREEFTQPPSDELHCSIETTWRYNEPVKHRNRFSSASDYPSSPTSADLRRCGYQLLRTTRENGPKNKRDIWTSDTTTTNSNIEKYGTGKDVDIVVADNGTWAGHIEFINNRPAGESPTDYVGGNLLPGDGISDLLSLVHDGPYYIDPDWFNASPGTRLETRWDGTTVPTNAAAISWWGSTGSRSSAFASYGTVSITSLCTRENTLGDFNTLPYDATHGTQCGSQLFGRTHGWSYNANKWVLDAFSSRSAGIDKIWDIQKIFHLAKPINPKYGTKDPTISSNSWGYRAWHPTTAYAFHRISSGIYFTSKAGAPAFMNLIGNYGDSGRIKSEFFDSAMVTSAKEMIDAGVITTVAAGNSNQKQVKWDHPDYDNYWHSTNSGHFGDGQVTANGTLAMPTINRPGFPQQAGSTWGDPQTFNISVSVSSNTWQLNGTDRNGSVSGTNPTVYINRGDTVNFNVSAPSPNNFYIKYHSGTGHQNQVNHPTATGQGSLYGTCSWTPNQRTKSTLTGDQYYYNCGTHSSMQGIIKVQTGNRTSPVIIVGGLDDQYATGTKERKVNYSDMGNNIDLFAPADGTLAAIPGYYSTNIPRYDNTYTSKSGGTSWSDGQTGSPAVSRDGRFSGTSAATPVATGLIATILELNRDWTWSDVKTWLGTLQNQTDMYNMTESITPTANYYVEALHGATPRVIYQGGTYSHATKETTTEDCTLGSGVSISGSFEIERD